MTNINHPIVAKFGGSSMAHPELVAKRIDQSANTPDIVVVSAAGKDAEYDYKMTDMLLDYEHKTSASTRDAILARLAVVASRVDIRMPPNADADIDSFTSNGHPLAALGEYWSAQLLARATGRQFINSADVIRFDANKEVDTAATTALLVNSINPDKRYVLPGFYGAASNGNIVTFERGGSDVTGALVAMALNASEYQNWSDVEGFYSANPRELASAQKVDELSYLEARELANGGSELLHREVGRYLNSTNIPTIMYSTLTGQAGTRVVASRDSATKPIVGISGKPTVLELAMTQFGSEEKVGTTVGLYKNLKRAGIPYAHATTSVDTVSVYIDSTHAEAAQRTFANQPHVSANEVASLHLVGEGLRDNPLLRTRTIGTVAMSLADQNIHIKGIADIGHCPGTTFFVEPERYKEALSAVHAAIVLG